MIDLLLGFAAVVFAAALLVLVGSVAYALALAEEVRKQDKR